MEKVETYINGIKREKSIGKEIHTVLEELNNLIKEVLLKRINGLKINPDYKSLIIDIMQHWRYPIKWNIHSTPFFYPKEDENNEYSLKFRVQQQLLIFTTPQEIEDHIGTIVETIQKHSDSKYLSCNEMVLLKRLHELYTSLPKSDGDDLKKIITRSFNVKYVGCDGDYANRDYFDSYQSDVAEEETRYEAMVSLADDSCIEKGTFLYPQNETEL